MSIPSTPPYIKFTSFSLLADNLDQVIIPRQPAYGNTFDLTKVRIFNDTGDYIISFRDDLWPRYDVLHFDIFPITKALSDALEVFMLAHCGELITIIIENISYFGVIQEPKIEIVDEKNDNCNYKITFVFETQECV